MGIEWNFLDKGQNETTIDPNDLLTKDTDFGQFARETIQNSLDALQRKEVSSYVEYRHARGGNFNASETKKGRKKFYELIWKSPSPFTKQLGNEWSFEKMQSLINSGMVSGDDTKPEKSDPQKPAVVKFSLFKEEHGMEKEIADRYFKTLSKHLKGKVTEAAKVNWNQDYIDPEYKKMSYMLVEDFNTRGMRGSSTIFEDPKQTDEIELSDFFYFNRTEGQTNKSGNQSGSAGVGKAVFPSMSKINSFISVTKRIQPEEKKGEDGYDEIVMIGRCKILPHWLKSHDRQKSGIGLYSLLNTSGNRSQSIQLPETDKEKISKLLHDFNSQRNLDKDFGSTIIIPAVKEEFIKTETLIYSICLNYFIPIIRGLIEVEVNQNSDNVAMINKDNILKLIEGIDEEKLLKTFDNYFDLNQLKGSADLFSKFNEKEIQNFDIERTSSSSSKTTEMNTNLTNAINSHKDFEEMKKLFAEYIPFSINIPIKFYGYDPHNKEDFESESEINLIIKKLEDTPKLYNPVFQRGNIRLSKEGIQRYGGKRNMLFIFLPGSELENMIRDSEPPTHDVMNPHDAAPVQGNSMFPLNPKNPKRKWGTNASTVIKFCKGIDSTIYKIFFDINAAGHSMFDDMFNISGGSITYLAQGGKKRRKRGKLKIKRKKVDLFNIDQKNKTVKAFVKNDFDKKLFKKVKTVELKMGYSLESGASAFLIDNVNIKSDFDLTDSAETTIYVSDSDANVLKPDPNKILITDFNDENLMIEVTNSKINTNKRLEVELICRDSKDREVS